ncbi:MAG: translation initiation factor IF-2 [Alphaproteobacteria bacterium]
MSDKDKNPPSHEKKPLTLSKKIDLKDLTDGQSRSSSKGGRTVIVEVKKNRSNSDKKQDAPTERAGLRASKPVLRAREKIEETSGSSDSSNAVSTQDKKLTIQEKEARLKALQNASRYVEEQAAQLDLSSKRAAELRQMEEENRRQKEELEESLKATQQAVAEEEAAAAGSAPSAEESSVSRDTNSESAFRKQKEKDDAEAPARQAIKRHDERRLTKISVSDVIMDEEGEDTYQRRRTRSMAAIKRAREKERMKLQRQQMSQEKITREVVIPEAITVQELANRMAEKVSDVIKCFMRMGTMVTITQSIDADTAQLIAEEMGHRVKRVSDADIEDVLAEDPDTEADLQPRPPVVTIMGHVDHGKTSLLDALRTTDVAAGEAGGITQHIGAYQVTLPSNQKITFIDTPGHAAFTEMRSRGANVTDIVVLVVAADDGIKEQTVEAINHAKAAKVPIIVAINKIDKPGADPARVRQELMQHEIFLEEFGGDVLSVEVSALKKMNLDKLEETILLQAEIANLSANPKPMASGVVVESRLEKGRGPVVTTLIQRGTLKSGDFFVAGSEWGRVRVLLNDHGKTVSTAGPSMPVEIIGFNGLPEAGDLFSVTQEESKAREIAEYRRHKRKEKQAALLDKKKMDNLFSKKGAHKELAVLIKGDVQGSVEAIASSLMKLKTDEVSVLVLHSGVGEVNETDVSLARASNALVIGFNVKANAQARELAQREGIEVRHYSIIYDIINDVKDLLGGLLSPILNEKYLGRAEVRRIFKISRLGHVAGCYVSDGFIKKSGKVRLLRGTEVVYQGTIKTLKRTTDEAKEIKSGFECGILLEGFNDIHEGDIIECSEIERIARTL